MVFPHSHSLELTTALGQIFHDMFGEMWRKSNIRLFWHWTKLHKQTWSGQVYFFQAVWQEPQSLTSKDPAVDHLKLIISKFTMFSCCSYCDDKQNPINSSEVPQQ